jgi:antitoxin YefM
MRATSVTDFRANIKAMLDGVVDDHVPLIVTRTGKDSVVVVSQRDWEGMQETLYLMSSPANARELLASIAELRAGKSEEHDLIDPEKP